MKKILIFAVALMTAVCGLADGGYTLSLRVENGQTESSTAKSGGKGGGRGSSTQTKTTTASMKWPVTVSCQGKDRPSKLKLKVYYIGTSNGDPEVLKEAEVDVTLNEKGSFKTELESPNAKLVKVTTRTNSGGRGGRGGRGRRGGGSSSTKTKTTGERVTGCIIQLMDGDKVAKSYASNPAWAPYAKKSPLPEEEVLKHR